MAADIEIRERPALYAFASAVVVERGARVVLDVACGDGGGTRDIAAGSPDAEVFGVDLDERLLARAQRFAGRRLRFERGDVRILRFADAAFDTVVSCHTIEHLNKRDQQKFLAELHRVLRPGGALVIATPDRDVWELLGIAGEQEDHVRELDQGEFLALVRDAGFRIEGVFGQQPLREGSFVARRVLNALKRLDVIGLRRMILGRYIKRIDESTRPTLPENSVVPLEIGQKASITVAVAVRSSP